MLLIVRKDESGTAAVGCGLSQLPFTDSGGYFWQFPREVLFPLPGTHFLTLEAKYLPNR